MMNRSTGSEEASVLRTLRILWIAILVAMIAYLVVAMTISGAREAERVASGPITILRWVFLALGLLFFVLAFRVREWMLRRIAVSEAGKARGTMTAFIVGWAFLDAIAILGLVLAFLGEGPLTSVPWICAAILGVLLQRPDREWLERWLGGGSQH